MTGVRCVCAQVRALPKLRILVMGLLKSLSSIAYIGLLLGLLFYLYVAPIAGTIYGPHSHGCGRGPSHGCARWERGRQDLYTPY